MKKNAMIILSAITLLFTAACNNETEYKTEKIDGMFSIDIPLYMHNVDLENPEASLSVGDETLERYVMVIYETKQEIEDYGVDMELDVNNYSNIVVEMFGQAFVNPQVTKVTETPKSINGVPALTFEISGEFAEVGEDIYSYVTVFESDKSFYTVYAWSLKTDERNFAPQAHHITESFKEL